MKAICAISLVLGLVGGDGTPAAQAAQAPRAGTAMQAKDGDVLLIEGDARVKLIRRREANATAVYNPAERWLVLMIDYARGGKPPDGGIDADFSYQEVAQWPLGERWSGAVVLDEYSVAGEFSSAIAAIGLTTDNGLIQLLGGPQASLFRDPAAASVIAFRGSTRGGAGNRPPAETEARLVAQASRNAQNNGRVPGNFATGVAMTADVSGGVVMNPPPPGSQPVRVGGSITKPTQTVRVEAVKPQRAIEAGVSGMVIIEATIGTDGSVTEAKVLRSIPLLDEPALAAVRQWKFTPTLLNGVPVPIIMTVTVNFP